MLFHKEPFLLLNLTAQFLFGRHVCHIFGRKKLLAAIKYRILCHYLIGLSAEQYTYSRIVTIVFYKVIVHPDIHIQLSHIRMCRGCVFNSNNT